MNQTTTPFTIRLLAGENEYQDAFSLLARSFPPEERRTLSDHLALTHEPSYRIYGRFCSASLIGFFALWHLDDVLFGEHLAISPDCRNGGHGAALLQHVLAELSLPMVLEVELPDTEWARRRIGFYRRNGFFYNDYPYLQPSLSPGQPAIPLHIMSHPAPLTSEAFTHIRDTLYRKVYRI